MFYTNDSDELDRNKDLKELEIDLFIEKIRPAFKGHYWGGDHKKPREIKEWKNGMQVEPEPRNDGSSTHWVCLFCSQILAKATTVCTRCGKEDVYQGDYSNLM